ncbi:MAG: ATP-dependent ligase [Rhodospirillales bacterium]|nr:ATP-dependent ligase [Rhodospirillales bacterium]
MLGVGSISIGLEPMEARTAEALPNDNGWQYEPKWDGFRCLAFRSGEDLELRAKSGKSLSRYFPDIVSALNALAPSRFVLDGELAIPVGDTLSFDALQMRLHPAESRVRKLAAETPAIMIVFDCLMEGQGVSLVDAPLTERRAALEDFFAALDDRGPLRLTPYTRDVSEAQRWLGRVGGSLDGVIAKRLSGPYRPGERDMIKVKQLRTADCVVGGFRYESGSRQLGSLLLGLYDDAGKLDHVGFTSGLSDAERPDLTRRLEALIAAPGFTGDAPGGPSRWSTERTSEWQPLRPELVVEVRYDHVTGKRFRHGTKLMRWRPDKAPRQCTFAQLERPLRPGKLVGEILSAG